MLLKFVTLARVRRLFSRQVQLLSSHRLLLRNGPPFRSTLLIGEDRNNNISTVNMKYEEKKQRKFKLNMGRAIDKLRTQLPNFFDRSELDFSIFANSIVVEDVSYSKLEVQKTFFISAIKTLRSAASISLINPSFKLQRIRYLEECRQIQCHVSIVLPDSVRVEGQAVWEGYIYFGLNDDGLVNSTIFDRRIPPVRPNSLLSNYFGWNFGKNPEVGFGTTSR